MYESYESMGPKHKRFLYSKDTLTEIRRLGGDVLVPMTGDDQPLPIPIAVLPATMSRAALAMCAQLLRFLLNDEHRIYTCEERPEDGAVVAYINTPIYEED